MVFPHTNMYSCAEIGGKTKTAELNWNSHKREAETHSKPLGCLAQNVLLVPCSSTFVVRRVRALGGVLEGPK